VLQEDKKQKKQRGGKQKNK